jgi:hypothetical protein
VGSSRAADRLKQPFDLAAWASRSTKQGARQAQAPKESPKCPVSKEDPMGHSTTRSPWQSSTANSLNTYSRYAERTDHSTPHTICLHAFCPTHRRSIDKPAQFGWEHWRECVSNSAEDPRSHPGQKQVRCLPHRGLTWANVASAQLQPLRNSGQRFPYVSVARLPAAWPPTTLRPAPTKLRR